MEGNPGLLISFHTRDLLGTSAGPRSHAVGPVLGPGKTWFPRRGPLDLVSTQWDLFWGPVRPRFHAVGPVLGAHKTSFPRSGTLVGPRWVLISTQWDLLGGPVGPGGPRFHAVGPPPRLGFTKLIGTGGGLEGRGGVGVGLGTHRRTSHWLWL